jgi:hypothetical protein
MTVGELGHVNHWDEMVTGTNQWVCHRRLRKERREKEKIMSTKIRDFFRKTNFKTGLQNYSGK